eukprot:TRINITY_DN8332_c0_g1_i1.p1 TRINITY_DN8332_c0_g1~~TRINITY_DN8332_c0_g1_i1.p1  ORF type:complete len:363 (-),score=68.60 TRINITY_DN8332_c0_g1_i1:49-1137(-)
MAFRMAPLLVFATLLAALFQVAVSTALPLHHRGARTGVRAGSAHRDHGRSGTSPTKVWIAGWPRSGSSTMFEMVLAGRHQQHKSPLQLRQLKRGRRAPAATTTETEGRGHFGLFEPCHWGLGNTTPPDRLDADLQGNCGKTMEKLLKCDFKGVHFLFGWSRYSGPHSDVSGIDVRATPYNPELATRRCSASNLLVYKTVNKFGWNISNVMPALDGDASLRVLVPVRDPRGVFASWKKRPWQNKGVRLLTEICDTMWHNMQQRHPRLYPIVYERLATEPVAVMQDVFRFLGQDFGAAQRTWIANTFNAPCGKLGMETGDFRACHKNSTEPTTRWRKILTQKEIVAFKQHGSCRKLAKANKYPL